MGTLVLSLPAAVHSYAQENVGRGRISGEVVDETGIPVANAKVVAESVLGSKIILEGKSNKKGHFAIANLGTGKWRVTATMEGYLEFSVEMPVSQLTPSPSIKLILKKKLDSPAAASGSPSNDEAIALIEKGNSRLQKSDLDGALAAYSEFSAKHPEIYKVRLNIGLLYCRKGEYDKAGTEFQSVLDKIMEKHGDYKADKSTATSAMSGLGEVALRKGDLEAAGKHFVEALTVSPEDEAAALNVGEIFFANQRTDEAINYFELAACIKPTWSKPFCRLGFAYLNKGEYDKSLENFKKFMKLDPTSPEADNVKNIMATVEKMKK
jgi:tetratricopeptide (TPR) repeat protein